MNFDISIYVWMVDPCQDENGFWTIRVEDGTEHGCTDCQPIATVFDRAVADHIVECHLAYINTAGK